MNIPVIGIHGGQASDQVSEQCNEPFSNKWQKVLTKISFLQKERPGFGTFAFYTRQNLQDPFQQGPIITIEYNVHTSLTM